MSNLANSIGVASYVARGTAPSYDPSGSIANINDLDTATNAYNITINNTGDFDTDFIVTLALAANITQVKVKATKLAQYTASCTATVSLYYSGSYHSIGTLSTGTALDNTFDGSWTNVTAIKITGVGDSAAGTSPPNVAQLGIYEVYAEGTYGVDSGFRVKTSSGTIPLAEERTLSSAARYRRGTTNRSFVLVDVSSAIASPVRVYTSSGVKAIAEYIA